MCEIVCKALQISLSLCVYVFLCTALHKSQERESFDVKRPAAQRVRQKDERLWVYGNRKASDISLSKVWILPHKEF